MLRQIEQFRINENREAILSDWFNCSIFKSPSAFSLNVLWWELADLEKWEEVW